MLRFASYASVLLLAFATTVTPVAAQSAQPKKGT
jgi:hypothetical protein